MYIGRYQSHTKAITGLEFKRGKDGERLLVPVGEDKRLVEYDLDESSVVKGVQLKGRVALTEQTGIIDATETLNKTAQMPTTAITVKTIVITE